MDQIERRVSLPLDAFPLNDYARYYSYGANGQIVAVYMIPFPEFPDGPDVGCSEMQADFSTREVECPELEFEHNIAAGQRVWLDDFRTLPSIDDGGCSVIEFEIQTDLQYLLEPRCNGSA